MVLSSNWHRRSSTRSSKLYKVFHELAYDTDTHMKLEHFKTQEEVRKHIQACEGKHMQQVAYSTFHDGLTQVCFGCKSIRTNISIL